MGPKEKADEAVEACAGEEKLKRPPLPVAVVPPLDNPVDVDVAAPVPKDDDDDVFIPLPPNENAPVEGAGAAPEDDEDPNKEKPVDEEGVVDEVAGAGVAPNENPPPDGALAVLGAPKLKAMARY